MLAHAAGPLPHAPEQLSCGALGRGCWSTAATDCRSSARTTRSVWPSAPPTNGRLAGIWL
eukprot:6373185-Lingulodinium_polyedra.AAC.1